jgi:hypothetical protein
MQETSKIAHGRYRKKCIFSLEHDNQKVEGLADLKAYVTQFYK